MFDCMYKMYDSQANLGVTNIYDLVKKIIGIYNIKKPAIKQIRTCKRKGKELIAGEKVEWLNYC